MIAARNIRDWRDHDVVDPEGHKIGQLEAIYVDTGIAGAVVQGLFYLLIIGIVVFLGAFIVLGLQLRRHRRRPLR